MSQPGSDRSSADDFARSAEAGSRGVVAEFVGMLRKSRKWWLAPIIMVLLALGVLLVLGATGVSPLIYALF